MTLLTSLQEKIRDIIVGALLDGQNQIHDLRSGRATAMEIDERMAKAMEYHGGKSDTLVSSTFRETLELVRETMRGQSHSDTHSSANLGIKRKVEVLHLNDFLAAIDKLEEENA